MADDYLKTLERATKDRYFIEGTDIFLRSFWIKEIAKHHSLSSAESRVDIDAQKVALREVVKKFGETDLLSTRYMIVMDNISALFKKDLKPFYAAFSSSPSVLVLMVDKIPKPRKGRPEDDLGNEKKLYKYLSAKSHVLDARKKTEFGILEWIRARTAGMALRANQDHLIAEYTGTDVGEVESAIEKVRLALKGGPLSSSDLREILNCRRSVTSWHAVDLWLSGQFSESLRCIEFIRQTQPPTWFLKKVEEMLRRAILAKEIKRTGRDPKSYALDFGNERNFLKAWETPISLSILTKMYWGLLPFFNKSRHATWDEVINYVYQQPVC